MLPTGEQPDTIARGMVLAIIILFMVIIAAGVHFYESEERQVKDAVTSELTSISFFKGRPDQRMAE